MSANWTENQRLAITARGGQIVVGAAAGSGKTTVLVERIVSILTDEAHPVDADRLLVVTFTNAAAAEMAARVKARIATLVAENPADRRLRRQQLLLMRAQISTVDSFCSALLREHFCELDLSPDFSVGSDAVIAQLRANALEETLAALYAAPDSGIVGLSDLFGRSRTDNATAALIERLYEFETTLAFPLDWEAACLAELESGISLAETKTGHFLLDYAARALTAAVALCTQALELAAEDEILDRNYTDALRYDMAFAKDLLAHADAGDWAVCAALANSYAPLRAGAKAGADESRKETVKGIRDKVKDIVASLCESCFCMDEGEYALDQAMLRRPLATLFDAKGRFEARLTALKKAKRTFEFSDLERMAVLLLGGETGEPTAVARELAARFEHVLVDEYQDTNEIQDLIFRLVSSEEKNLFCVGDVKQSVYSFRRADPEIFLRRRANCKPSEQGLFPMRITLAENFRSSGAVVDAVNAVFSPIMTAAVGGTDYADGEGLIAGLEAGSGAVNPERCGLDVRLYPAGEEPAQVAREIARLLRDGYTVQTKDKTRACVESDFCILLRSPKDRAQVYKDALEAVGVRVWTDGADNLYDNSEVAVLISLLRVIDNPRRDVDLAAVLLSPLYGFTTDDLVRLRLLDRRATLYALLLMSGEDKCRAFVASLSALRARRSTLAVDELVRFIADETDAELLLCAGDELSRRRDNIRLLIETASEFSRGADGSLSAFLRVCERAAASGKVVTRAFSPPDDAVCITSIHKSKGLEWPVVFVANADKRFNRSDSRDSAMLFDARYGAGARVRVPCADGSALYSKKTVQYQAISLAATEKTTSEEMRVLYVALTRARQKLYLTAEVAKAAERVEMLGACLVNGRLDPYMVGAQNGYINWALLGLFARYSAAAGRLAADGLFEADSVRIALAPPMAEVAAVAAAADETVSADPALVAVLDARARFVNPRLALADLPTKLSVTALAKESGAVRLSAPDFARASASAAHRGTAIHLFMQCADYARAAVSVREELARLVAGGYLAERDAAEMDVPKLERLFASEFGRSIATAPHLLREYDFIDSIPASALTALPDDLGDARIMIQGIADCVILEPDGAVLVDYKSDRVTSGDELIVRYAEQLRLYKMALDKRLELPVKRCVIYSFALGKPVDLVF